MMDRIQTERLTLRRPRTSDAGPMSLYAADLRVSGMTTSIPHPYLPEMAEDYLNGLEKRPDKGPVWAIDATLSGGAEFIGVISYKSDENEIGYWVGPPFWSTGYATEAVNAVVAHLRSGHGLGDLAASVFFDNPASAQVLRKSGFEDAGRAWAYSIARGVEVPTLLFLNPAP